MFFPWWLWWLFIHRQWRQSHRVFLTRVLTFNVSTFFFFFLSFGLNLAELMLSDSRITPAYEIQKINAIPKHNTFALCNISCSLGNKWAYASFETLRIMNRKIKYELHLPTQHYWVQWEIKQPLSELQWGLYSHSRLFDISLDCEIQPGHELHCPCVIAIGLGVSQEYSL